MDINLAHRPRGATHAGKEETHGSWYKKSEAGHWVFIDMGEDGLPDRQWCVVPDDEPGYELFELPLEDLRQASPAQLKPDGGAAFPQSGYERWAPEGGMTLRDYFAAKALQGTLASSQIKGNTGLENWKYEDFAQFAYSLADAMLVARGGS